MIKRLSAAARRSISHHSLGLRWREHSFSTKDQMSATRNQLGLSVGTNNPMYGTVSPTAQTTFVYNLNGELVQQFTSQTAAAKWLGVSQVTVSKHVKSGKVFRNQYLIKNTSH